LYQKYFCQTLKSADLSSSCSR